MKAQKSLRPSIALTWLDLPIYVGGLNSAGFIFTITLAISILNSQLQPKVFCAFGCNKNFHFSQISCHATFQETLLHIAPLRRSIVMQLSVHLNSYRCKVSIRFLVLLCLCFSLVRTHGKNNGFPCIQCESKSSPLKLFAIFSLRLGIFPWNFVLCDEPVALFRPMRESIIVRVSFGSCGHVCFP